jgi:MFS family permease
MSDRHLLYAAAFLRALATGLLGVLLGLYLARLGFAPAALGSVLSAGLGGAALAALAATLGGDRLGRRRALLALALLSAAGGAAASLASSLPAMAAAAFLGMLNGQGRDRGAALILEQAALPGTTDDRGRTRAFAWYNLLQDTGHALGGLLAALPELLRAPDADPLLSLRLAMAGYAALVGASAVCYARLGRAIERADARAPLHLSPGSRRVLTRISLLFGLDSLAGGFLGTALLAYFFQARFGAGEGVIALLFAAARVANALSHLAAAWLARRIGLVNTMVFTHMPSSLLLMTVPLAPDFATAAALFLLREGLVEMDVPTRQSYVMAVVRAEERTLASGVTHLVRLGGWALAPSFAGALMQSLALGSPLVVGAAMKVAYDALLWLAFRRIRPPEEGGPGPEGAHRQA